MQLHRHDEIESLHAEQTFYTSPMVMLLLPLIFSAISIGVAWAILAGNLPGLMWCSVVFVAPFVPLVFWINFLPALRPTNWVVKTASNRVYVNLRNYRNAHSPDDGPTVASFAQNDIASIGKHMERFVSISGKGRATYWTEYSLEFRLREPAPSELATTLEAERRREAPKRGWMRIGLYAPLVSLDNDGRAIRIIWYSRYDHITPRINKAIALLGRTFLTHEEVFINNADLEKLSDIQFDEMIVKLLQGDAKLDAISLLKKRRGMSTTEAKQFTDELLQKHR